MSKYMKPEFAKKAFTCPHCEVYAQMDGWRMVRYELPKGQFHKFGEHVYVCRICVSCKKEIVWQLLAELESDGKKFKSIKEAKMVYPKQKEMDYMPEEIGEIYNQASSVLKISPIASCILSRLILEKIMRYLKEKIKKYNGLKNKNLSQDIEEVIKIGDFNKTQEEILKKAMDCVRKIGNQAAHPADFNVDDPEIPTILLKVVDFIVKEIVSDYAEITGQLDKLDQIISKSSKNDQFE